MIDPTVMNKPSGLSYSPIFCLILRLMVVAKGYSSTVATSYSSRISSVGYKYLAVSDKANVSGSSCYLVFAFKLLSVANTNVMPDDAVQFLFAGLRSHPFVHCIESFD